MTPELAAACILLGDWGTAASHMAYAVDSRTARYRRKVPLFIDVWHLVAGLRYGAFGALAWVAFPSWEWYAGTAFVNWLGWCALKKLHGKPWPLIPAWIRNLRA